MESCIDVSSVQLIKMADKGRLTVQQRAKLVLLYAQTKSVIVTQRRFRQHFNTRWTPAKNTLYKLYRKLENKGTLLEPKRSRVPQVRSPQNVEAVRVAMQRSPGKSTRRAAKELGISRRSIQRILHLDLHLFPYKMTVLHSLSDREKQQRLQYAAWAMETVGTIDNCWFSDEAYFHLNGVVNKQNVRFWAAERPLHFHERDNYGEKVCVWAAISSHGIIGPFFFDDTVNAVRYMSMLRNQFLPALYATNLPIHTQWFMQDGARPHTANAVLDFLHETFGERVMSHRFPQRLQCGQIWPPHSPDLNPCDYFLWGYLKEKVFCQHPQNMMELRASIMQMCGTITKDLCRCVVRNVNVRLEEMVQQNDGHIEHVLH